MVGLIVTSHFENPAKNHVLEFLADVLKWRKRCIIPTSAILGSYHILTRFLRVDRISAYNALVRTLASILRRFKR